MVGNFWKKKVLSLDSFFERENLILNYKYQFANQDL